MKRVASKLSQEDEVRIIAPSLSLKIVSAENIKYAVDKLESLGLKVTFGEHVNEEDIFNSSSITSRLNDLHTAFKDEKVKAILAVIGGQ